MFIYSVRGSTVKFFAVIALTLAVLVGVLSFGGFGSVAASANSDIKLGGIRTNEDRIAFITQFGITVKGEAKESESFSVPEHFDRVISEYNEIQKSQGLDISKYKNKKVTRYTYEAESYGDYKGTVYVNLIIYRNTVIACDVSSAVSSGGFVEPLIKFN